jgi:hypothetical protein
MKRGDKMEARICDRCGEICGEEKYEIVCTKYIKHLKIICDYDLCIKCASKFEKWLECEENKNASNMG